MILKMIMMVMNDDDDDDGDTPWEAEVRAAAKLRKESSWEALREVRASPRLRKAV